MSTVLGAMRRNTELGLILLAVVLTAGAYALASLGRSASLPGEHRPVPAVILGLLAAAHLATRRLAPERRRHPAADRRPAQRHRLRLHRPPRRATSPRLQALWTARRHRRLRRHAGRRPPGPGPRALPLHVRPRRHRPAAPAAAARRRPEHQRRPHLGAARADRLPARRAGQDRPRHLLRLLPGREARAAGHGDPAGRPA